MLRTGGGTLASVSLPANITSQRGLTATEGLSVSPKKDALAVGERALCSMC